MFAFERLRRVCLQRDCSNDEHNRGKCKSKYFSCKSENETIYNEFGERDLGMNKINKENIEAYLLDLVEGTINQADKEEVFAFLKQNPEYKEMLALYDKELVLQEDPSICYEDKESLKHKVIFPYWKRVVYVASSVAAVVLLFFLLKPSTDVVTNSTKPTNTIARIAPEAGHPTDKELVIGDTTNTFTPNKKSNKVKAVDSFKTTTPKEETPVYYEENVTENTTISTNNQTNPQDLIAQNNAYVFNNVKNDTVYIIYVGGKQDYTKKVVDFVEKHTNVNVAPAVTFIKQTANKVKETKNKYLKI